MRRLSQRRNRCTSLRTSPHRRPNPRSPACRPERLTEIGRQTLFVNTGRATGLTCPKCGHVNRPGVLVCENCGTLMVNEEQATGTKRFESDKQEADADPKRNTSIETTEMVSVAMSTAGTRTFSEDMVLRLEVEGAPTPILLSPKYETSIGRRDPATGTQPDVDLSTYSGYRLGVSRKHAVIRLNNKQLEIYDLGSSNGTSVNGVAAGRAPAAPAARRRRDHARQNDGSGAVSGAQPPEVVGRKNSTGERDCDYPARYYFRLDLTRIVLRAEAFSTSAAAFAGANRTWLRRASFSTSTASDARPRRVDDHHAFFAFHQQALKLALRQPTERALRQPDQRGGHGGDLRAARRVLVRDFPRCRAETRRPAARRCSRSPTP